MSYPTNPTRGGNPPTSPPQSSPQQQPLHPVKHVSQQTLTGTGSGPGPGGGSTGGGNLGLRYPSNRKTIYDRNLNRSRTAELSRASFALLFGEMIGYAQRRVTGIQDLEKRLNNQGFPMGLRLLDLLLYREPIRTAQRPTRILALLQFITTTVWRHLFNRQADALERSKDNEDEYMIADNDPVVNQYVSIPKEMNQLNCAAYVAGIVEGVCSGAGFPARVTAHSVPNDLWPGRTVFLIKFAEEVLERETFLAKS
ncbi:MAG: DNA-directed DNA polymerase alpha subunit pol12 [Watsoniomyces obsoletus]|nr:MAG: DNA-directed DNA polymerase alpha subunit pol12 [Watsoniomyces obsoletus]